MVVHNACFLNSLDTISEITAAKIVVVVQVVAVAAHATASDITLVRSVEVKSDVPDCSQKEDCNRSQANYSIPNC